MGGRVCWGQEDPVEGCGAEYVLLMKYSVVDRTRVCTGAGGNDSGCLSCLALKLLSRRIEVLIYWTTLSIRRWRLFLLQANLLPFRSEYRTDPDHPEIPVPGAWGSIVSFILFKLLYPYPDFFSDSYSYLEAAYFNQDIAIWPIGYSKFLWAFHYLTHSDTAFVAFQYFFLQISALYLFFSILYLYQPSEVTKSYCLPSSF